MNYCCYYYALGAAPFPEPVSSACVEVGSASLLRNLPSYEAAVPSPSHRISTPSSPSRNSPAQNLHCAEFERERFCVWLCARQPALPFTPLCQAELLPGLSGLEDGVLRTPPKSYCTGRVHGAAPHSAMSSLKRFIMFFIFALPPTTLLVPVSAGVCV